MVFVGDIYIYVYIVNGLINPFITGGAPPCTSVNDVFSSGFGHVIFTGLTGLGQATCLWVGLPLIACRSACVDIATKQIINR